MQARVLGRVVRLLLGWSLIALGIVGLVLPVLQGWFLIGVGALLLAPEVPLFGRLVYWIEKRFPRVGRVTARLRRRLGKVVPPSEGPPS